MVETVIAVNHNVGLHARPASLFVQAAKKFASDITVRNVTSGSKTVNAKSIIGLLGLGVQQGNQIHIQASGADAEAAITTLQGLIESNFYEEQTLG
jgi:phosphocarrier protein HPr